jgi:hypothetical protein
MLPKGEKVALIFRIGLGGEQGVNLLVERVVAMARNDPEAAVRFWHEAVAALPIVDRVGAHMQLGNVVECIAAILPDVADKHGREVTHAEKKSWLRELLQRLPTRH